MVTDTNIEEEVTIIKNGDLDLATRKRKRIKRFTCGLCGCVFDASAKYYKESQYDGTYAECICCGETVYL